MSLFKVSGVHLPDRRRSWALAWSLEAAMGGAWYLAAELSGGVVPSGRARRGRGPWRRPWS